MESLFKILQFNACYYRHILQTHTDRQTQTETGGEGDRDRQMEERRLGGGEAGSRDKWAGGNAEGGRDRKGDREGLDK